MIFFTVFLAVLGFFAALFFIRFLHIVLPIAGVLLVFVLLGAKHEQEENLKWYSSSVGLTPNATPTPTPDGQLRSVAAVNSHGASELKIAEERQREFDTQAIKEWQAETKRWNESQKSSE